MSRIEENLKLTTVLFRAIHGIERLLRNDIQSYGLNTTEFGVLELLYHQDEQPIQGICQKLLMANSSMTYVIDKLEERRFVTRVLHTSDKRVTLIRLTQEGKAFFDQIFPIHQYMLTELYQMLSDEEQKQLIDLLKKIGFQAKRMKGNIK